MTTPLSIHRPSAGPATRGVVVVQEAFGVNDHIEDVAARLAAAGYLAVAPHLFHRSGDPALGYEDFSLVMPHMKELTADGILEDIDAAIAAIEAEGIDRSRIAITGFCLGGAVSLIVAARRDIGAAVTWYGGGVAEGRFGFDAGVVEVTRLRAPWLGLYGDLDQSIPVEQVEAIRAAAATSDQPTEVVRYADADHGFNCDARPHHHPEAAADGWARMLAWFDQHLGT